MPDFIKIAKVAEKAAEELIEHNPAAQKMGLKLLEESGILGNAIKLVTKEFQHLAGAIETKGVFPRITQTFEKKIPWQSDFVKGLDAKTISMCGKGMQTIENPAGISQVKNLTATGNELGFDVLKLGPAPKFVHEQGFAMTAAKGVPNWVHGSDDWLFYQANHELPTKVVLDDIGRLHAIEYLDEVKALAGPFKGLSGTRFEINYTANGLKTAKMNYKGGRAAGYYDQYEYAFGTTKLKCSNFNPASKSYELKNHDLAPEDISGFPHRTYDGSSWTVLFKPLDKA